MSNPKICVIVQRNLKMKQFASFLIKKVWVTRHSRGSNRESSHISAWIPDYYLGDDAFHIKNVFKNTLLSNKTHNLLIIKQMLFLLL